KFWKSFNVFFNNWLRTSTFSCIILIRGYYFISSNKNNIAIILVRKYIDKHAMFNNKKSEGILSLGFLLIIFSKLFNTFLNFISYHLKNTPLFFFSAFCFRRVLDSPMPSSTLWCCRCTTIFSNPPQRNHKVCIV